MIRQPARLGQPGQASLLVAPIRLTDFPVRRSQRSDHGALPPDRWSRGSLVSPHGANVQRVGRAAEVGLGEAEGPGRSNLKACVGGGIEELDRIVRLIFP